MAGVEDFLADRAIGRIAAGRKFVGLLPRILIECMPCSRMRRAMDMDLCDIGLNGEGEEGEECDRQPQGIALHLSSQNSCFRRNAHALLRLCQTGGAGQRAYRVGFSPGLPRLRAFCGGISVKMLEHDKDETFDL